VLVNLSRPPILRSTRALAVAAAVGLLGASCASKAGTAAQPSPNGRIVQITPVDAGKVTQLHVGDTLRIVLGAPLGGTVLNWKVRGYTRGVLSAPLHSAVEGRLEFLAQAQGSGSISLVGLARCGPGPGPYSAGVQCPAVGGGAGASPTVVVNGGGNMPSRLLVFDVSVSG
jgi:hypothetical protein